jgi:ArsR family transcriptional regulator
MAITKAQLFSEKEVKAAEFAKALSHPARIAILEILARRNACYCGDITEELPLAQSTVSQHLKALKTAGIIKGEIEGIRTCYCLDEDNLTAFRSILDEFFSDLKSKNPNCC